MDRSFGVRGLMFVAKRMTEPNTGAATANEASFYRHLGEVVVPSPASRISKR